jgi:hypothetical protein
VRYFASRNTASGYIASGHVALKLSVGVALVLGGLLGGCARDPYVTSAGEFTSGDWRISQQKDRVTGANLPSVALMAQASNTYNDFPKPSMMQMTCFDGKPLVRFSFEWKIGADVNTTLGYRFDDKPGRDNVPGVRFMQDERMVVIEETSDVVQFVNDLRESRLLYLRIRSITQGRTTAEYKLDGSEPAVRSAFADCPLPAVAPASLAKKRVS